MITVELTEFADRVVTNNDPVEEIQLGLLIHQNRVPRWNESLLMSMSLQAVERIALPLTRCLGVLTNIPVFAFFPWTVSLSRTILTMLDWLSYNWMVAQLRYPNYEFKLVITLIHDQ